MINRTLGYLSTMTNTRNTHDVQEAMHTTFPVTSTCAFVSKLPTGEGREAIEPSIFR